MLVCQARLECLPLKIRLIDLLLAVSRFDAPEPEASDFDTRLGDSQVLGLTCGVENRQDVPFATLSPSVTRTSLSRPEINAAISSSPRTDSTRPVQTRLPGGGFGSGRGICLCCGGAFAGRAELLDVDRPCRSERGPPRP